MVTLALLFRTSTTPLLLSAEIIEDSSRGWHGVQKEDKKPPQGNELKAPFGELVVTGRRQMAARADCGRTLARTHGQFDTLLAGTLMGVLVDKASETGTVV